MEIGVDAWLYTLSEDSDGAGRKTGGMRRGGEEACGSGVPTRDGVLEREYEE